MDTTITVTGRKMENSTASVLKQRQNNTAVSDGISAEQISASGGGDAAQAVQKIVGASIVDGKHVYVRGLGGRYTNSQLNGAPMPSPDPDEQTLPMDLVPANLLDNIVVSKSFTPDRPGDFAGGSVDLSTKDYPGRRTLVISTSAGYNTKTSLQSGYLSQNSSSTDWLGHDNGQRAIPDIVLDNPTLQEEVPNARFINVSQDGLADSLALVEYIDKASRAFRNEMVPSSGDAPLNQSYALSFGDRWTLFDRPFGVVASLSYSRKHSSQSGVQGRYSRGSVNTDELTADYIFDNVEGSDNVLAGGLLNFTYGFAEGHSISWNLMHDRSGESKARYLLGPWFYYSNDPNSKVRNYALTYTERELTSNQIQGKHSLFGGRMRADWQFSVSNTHQNDPDTRYFVDEVEQRQYEDDDGNLVDTTVYLIRLDRYPAPTRLYRELEEKGRGSQLDLTFPFGEEFEIKAGAAFAKNQRLQKERRFEYQNTSAYASYNGDIDAYLSDVGLDTVRTRVFQGDTIYQYLYTNFLRETTEGRNQYSGDKRVYAGYGMLKLPVFNRLSFIGGVRIERTDMFTLTASTSANNRLGEIKSDDWLPSLNLVYHIGYEMNVRASYGRTLARPTLREMTPSASNEFGTGEFFNGNPNLEITKINNYDLRWEWFVRPGEVMAVSGFYKTIANPIEYSIVGDNNDIVVINSEDATVYGLEFEARRRFDWLHPRLADFVIGGNLTLAHSKVRIGEKELAELQGEYPGADEYREMAGQSPYVINLDLSYDNFDKGTRIGVFYNVFGTRFAFNSDHITPDVYEQARHQLDVQVSQKVFAGATLKLGFKNLLDADHEFVYEDKVANSHTEVYERISPGRDITVGLAYQVW
jgi:outer membrane receptor protein involved in Fe transport